MLCARVVLSTLLASYSGSGGGAGSSGGRQVVPALGVDVEKLQIRAARETSARLATLEGEPAGVKKPRRRAKGEKTADHARADDASGGDVDGRARDAAGAAAGAAAHDQAVDRADQGAGGILPINLYFLSPCQRPVPRDIKAASPNRGPSPGGGGRNPLLCPPERGARIHPSEWILSRGKCAAESLQPDELRAPSCRGRAGAGASSHEAPPETAGRAALAPSRSSPSRPLSQRT